MSKGNLIIPKIFLRAFGPEKSVFIANLIDKYRLNNIRHPENNGWFFQINEHQIFTTGLSRKKIIDFKKFFTKLNLISIEKRGCPAKEFYWLNPQKILDYSRTKINTTSRTDGGTTYLNIETNNIKVMVSAKPCIEKIVSLWNRLEGPTTHSKPNTKTLKKVSNLISQLLEGTFFHKNTITDEFCKTHQIPKERFFKNPPVKFTQKQIEEAIGQFEKCWQDDYWPPNKKTLPKSLENFFHNSMTGASWFLMLHYNKAITNGNAANYNSRYYPMLEWYLPRSGAGTIHRMVDGLGRWVEDNFDLSNRRVIHHFVSNNGGPKLKPFFEKYSRWLRNEAINTWKEDWVMDNPKQVFTPWGEVFLGFLNYLSEDCALRTMRRRG